MKLLGTIDEWLKHKPKAWLRNDEILRLKGMAIFNITKHPELIECTYPSGRYWDGAEPLLYVGAATMCPYMLKGKFSYTCGLTNYEFGAAGSAVLSDNQANNPNWYEWTMDDYYGKV